MGVAAVIIGSNLQYRSQEYVCPITTVYIQVTQSKRHQQSVFKQNRISAQLIRDEYQPESQVVCHFRYGMPTTAKLKESS